MRTFMVVAACLALLSSSRADEPRPPVAPFVPRPRATSGTQRIVQAAATATQRDDDQLKLLERKRAVLAKLQEEVAELAEATGQFTQVRVSIRAIELQRSKLRQLGLRNPLESDELVQRDQTGAPLPSLPAGLPWSGVNKFTNEKQMLLAFKPLIEKECAEYLTTTTLVTALGQPTTLTTFGEPLLVPMPDGQGGFVEKPIDPTGVRINVLPRLLPNNQIHIDARCEIRAVDSSQQIKVQGRALPGVNARRIETPISMRSGETVVIQGLISKRRPTAVQGTLNSVLPAFMKSNAAEVEIELIVLVTCELVTPEWNGISR